MRVGRPRAVEVDKLTQPAGVAYATGAVDNLELRCRAHNQYEAELFYGSRAQRRIRPGASSPSADPHKRAGP